MYLSTTLDSATVPLSTTPPSIASIAGLVSKGGDSQLQRWSSLIGIITAIVGNILISFALNIQRYAHIRLHEEKLQRKEKSKFLAKGSRTGYGTTGANGNHVVEEHPQDGAEDDPLTRSFQSGASKSTTNSEDDDNQDSTTYLRSPYWWGGIVLMTVGEAGNFLAYGFAPASIVSPLGVVALISNCVIAPIMLKERFRLRDFWGVVVAVGGAVTVVLSAKTQERKFGPHEILGAITTLEFEIYMTVTIILIGVLMWASPRYGSKTILVDLGLVGLFGKLTDHELNSANRIAGGYTALSTKGVASMLSYTFWRALTFPVTYALVAILVGTAIMQVKYVNKALQRFDSTQVIPVQFVMFTLSVIMGSAILYRDFEKATAENVGKFIGGCLLTFFGVFLITSGRPRHDDDEEGEDESDEEGEERIGLAYQDPVGDENQPPAGNYASMRRRSKLEVHAGDGGYDSDVTDSRRSSRVSFAEPSPQPRTPRLYSNSSNRPSIQVGSGFESDQSGTDNTPLLLSNPWKESVDDNLQAARHPGISSVNSTPQLPSEAQAPSSDSLKPPPLNSRSATHENLHTHPNLHHEPAPPQADRPYTPARHSISRMLPGPLISPLSSGLSAIVADSLRRGVDSPSRSKSFRRARLGIRRTKSGSQRLTRSSDAEDEFGTSQLKQSTTTEEVSRSLGTEGGDWSRVTRARSLSNTLGELFRGKRQKTDRSDDADEEAVAGPSNS